MPNRHEALSVLKSGTSQSRPIRQSRLSTNPPRHGHADTWRSHGSICRRAIPKRTFIVRQVRTAASLSTGCRPRLPVGRATHAMSGSNQTVSDPRRSSAFAIGPEPMAPQWLTLRGPVQGLVGRCVRSAHPPQLSRWIHEMNPRRDLCNKAEQDRNRIDRENNRRAARRGRRPANCRKRWHRRGKVCPAPLAYRGATRPPHRKAPQGPVSPLGYPCLPQRPKGPLGAFLRNLSVIAFPALQCANGAAQAFPTLFARSGCFPVRDYGINADLFP